jgi:hypothetical protein
MYASQAAAYSHAFVRAMLHGRIVRRTISDRHTYAEERQLHQVSEKDCEMYEELAKGENIYSDENWSERQNDLLRGTKYRRFFITRSGYFGFAYGRIKPNDEVYVLCGGRTPFILSRLSDSPMSTFHWKEAVTWKVS